VKVLEQGDALGIRSTELGILEVDVVHDLGDRTEPRIAQPEAFEHVEAALVALVGEATAASAGSDGSATTVGTSVLPRPTYSGCTIADAIVSASSIELSYGEPRFVDGTNPVGPRFARLDATSIGVTTRATWTLARDLTVQAYVQALLASLRHRDAFVADPALRVIGIDQLQAASFDPATYDAREGALNATLVARWEYRPGSTAFLVYSHAQTPAIGVGSSLRPSFTAPPRMRCCSSSPGRGCADQASSGGWTWRNARHSNRS
jgi:hypothetical protein